MNDSTIGPPIKRRKISEAHVPSSTNTAKVSVKRELSPTPPPSLALRTSGTKRVLLPPSCRKTQAGWKESRDKWVTDEIAKLRLLGLRVTRRVVREDGLALDWVSSVPVSPFTLLPDVEPVRENPISHASSVSVVPYTDPLGRALRDQTSSASLRGPLVSDALPRDTSFTGSKPRVSQPFPKDGRNDLSTFAVVGAALIKKSRNANQDSVVHSVPDEPAHSEHRKLFPADLRVPPPHYASRETFKNWRARRRAWVVKEMEKVEGYTGGHARGFKYDGDDAIIFIQNRLNPGEHGASNGKRDSFLPPPISSVKSNAVNSNNELEPAKLASPTISTRSPQRDDLENNTESSRKPVTYLSVDGKITDQAQRRPSEASVIVQAARGPQPPGTAFTSNLEEPDIDHALEVTQTFGLGFLEQYLRMFDSDRGRLGAAYTANATLSLRTEEGYCKILNASKISSRPPLAGMNQVTNTGPAAIVETLQQLSPHLHHSTLCDIVYNIATLDDMSPGGLLLTCDGVMVHPDDPQQPPEWSFSRTFVLKQNVEETRWLWPMKIVAEKLTISRRST